MQAVSTPSRRPSLTAPPHVASAAQLSHGALPDADHVAPATHGTSHTVSVVVVHDCLTPAAQVDTSVHASHGALPEAEKEVPPTHGATAPLHTTSDPGVQAILTPAAHVASVEQLSHGVPHGAYPVADHDVPATHGTLHAVSVVVLQAVSTPAAPPQLVSAEQIVHGA